MPFLPLNDPQHAVIHSGSIIIAVIVQVVSDCFFILARDGNVPNALFQATLRNGTETFPLEVTMDWWSENYWIIIDLWSKAWLVEAVVRLCRRNALGPESCNPEIHPPLFYHLWTTATIARMYGMLLQDRHYIIEVTVLRWIQPAFSFYMLYISYFNLHKHKAWLAINNPNAILWTRYLTQNGLAAFAWWSLLNAAVSLGVVLKYKAGVPEPLVSTIVLIVISLCIIVWFILQLFLLTKYMRYTFTVYPILILGLGAMFTRGYRVHDFTANIIYCGFLMILITIINFILLINVCSHSDDPRTPELTVDHNRKFQSIETVCHMEGFRKVEKSQY